jgi:hypothetical protein
MIFLAATMAMFIAAFVIFKRKMNVQNMRWGT